MKLFHSPNSPYSRKCRLIIAEKKLQGIEQIALMPADNPPELWAVNPLGTVPAMVTKDGMHLTDSTVIAEYLDSLPSSEPSLLGDNDARLCILALAALADGIMDAAVVCTQERRRPQENQYPVWIARKENAAMRGIEKIAGANLDFNLPLTLGTLNLAVALHYVDFRLPDLAWRMHYKTLAAWADAMAKRPAFAATMPKA